MFGTGRKTAHSLFAIAATLSLFPVGARADVFDDAWECGVAAVDGIVLTATVGAKALKFVATKPECVTRMGTPATMVPISVVVTMCNAGALPESQPDCSNAIYGVAAKPIAAALGAALDSFGILPGAQTHLSEIAVGTLGGELLADVPGIDTVTGSLTCGCELVEAGLSIETIKTALNTVDRVGDACGGPVWDAAKKAVGEVVNFAGDAASEGARQVSNLGDAIAGQSKHVHTQVYFDQHWAPRVEDFAAVEFSSAGAWHTHQKWKELWNPCVGYFDTHTMSATNAQATCDDMRSGTSRENGLFAGKGFSQRMFRRVFEFDVTRKVDAARTNAYADYAELQIDVPVPQKVVDDIDGSLITAKADARWIAERTKLVQDAVDAVFGTAKKEKQRNGLQTSAQTPPTSWSAGTVGARAFDFYDQVKGHEGNDRANAAKAVQLAMQDIDGQVRTNLEQAKVNLYVGELNSALFVREVNRDHGQEKINGLIGACDSQECKDKIASEFAVCRGETKAWYAENESTIANFDSAAGKAATREWESRSAACLKQASDTLRDSRTAVQGDTTRFGRDVPQGIPTTSGGFNGRLGGTRDRFNGTDVDNGARATVHDNDARDNPPLSRRDSIDSLRKHQQSLDDPSPEVAPESGSASEPEYETSELLEPVTGAPGEEPLRVPGGGTLRLRMPPSVAPDAVPAAEPDVDVEPAFEAESQPEPEPEVEANVEAEAEAEVETEAEVEVEAAQESESDATEVMDPVTGAPGTEPVRVRGGVGLRLRTPLGVAPALEAEVEAEAEAGAESESEPQAEPDT